MELAEALRGLGLPYGTDTLDRIARFRDDVYAYNAVKNLTRIPFEDFYILHILDSLLMAEFCPSGGFVLDIGTGPGFPAWPLALTRPDLRVDAVDSNGKMLDFLRGQPLPNLRVIQSRAEDLELRDRYDVVTGRAVAPLALQLELSAAFARKNGFVIPMRSAAEAGGFGNRVFERLGLQLESEDLRTLPGTEVVRAFPKYRKVKVTPARYPRRWAEMKSSPLA